MPESRRIADNRYAAVRLRFPFDRILPISTLKRRSTFGLPSVSFLTLSGHTKTLADWQTIDQNSLPAGHDDTSVIDC
jgi:hypothetical protein